MILSDTGVESAARIANAILTDLRKLDAIHDSCEDQWAV